ncbi:MAG: protease inhibitor I42 family protein [Chlorobiales bacterium]|jgi:inhibitor of cysteine peptidase|nr:protease inhibitor I42 family protein [Chlorobiales bacterium]
MLIPYLFTIFSIGFLCACGGEPPSIKTAKQITEADANQSIELRVGDKLEVVLSGNPTTGFQWEISDADTTILRANGESEFKPSTNNDAIVGSGGKVIMRFDAVKAGKMKLGFIYHRVFEKDVPPAQTFEVTVVVK